MMPEEKNKLKWILVGFGVLVIVILFAYLMFLIFSENNLPENAVIVDGAVLEGEALNQQMAEKIEKLSEENPALLKLPLTVEFYADDYSKYTKYTISYAFDDSEKGFYLMMKDYTAEGEENILIKTKELGFDIANIRYQYEDLSQELMNGHAD